MQRASLENRSGREVWVNPDVSEDDSLCGNCANRAFCPFRGELDQAEDEGLIVVVAGCREFLDKRE